MSGRERPPNRANQTIVAGPGEASGIVEIPGIVAGVSSVAETPNVTVHTANSGTPRTVTSTSSRREPEVGHLQPGVSGPGIARSISVVPAIRTGNPAALPESLATYL